MWNKIIKQDCVLRHDFLQWEEHIARRLWLIWWTSWPGYWSKLDKGPSCLSFDYTRCFNNAVYTHTDVPKHRFYYCTRTNRYTDTETGSARLLDGSPVCIKTSLCTGAPNSFECGFFLMFNLCKGLLPDGNVSSLTSTGSKNGEFINQNHVFCDEA